MGETLAEKLVGSFQRVHNAKHAPHPLVRGIATQLKFR